MVYSAPLVDTPDRDFELVVIDGKRNRMLHHTRYIGLQTLQDATFAIDDDQNVYFTTRTATRFANI